MKIIFICKHNRFRSKIAEALFRKLNKNKKIKISSAGLIKGSPISKQIINVAKSHEINVKGKPKFLSSKLLKQQNILVNVAENVPSQIFREYKNLKIMSWHIRDVLSQNHYNRRTGKTIEEIRKKVEKLVKKLEKV
jgi:protein-tyrosine-phosphatase